MQRYITDDFGNIIIPEMSIWQYIIWLMILEADMERDTL